MISPALLRLNPVRFKSRALCAGFLLMLRRCIAFLGRLFPCFADKVRRIPEKTASFLGLLPLTI